VPTLSWRVMACANEMGSTEFPSTQEAVSGPLAAISKVTVFRCPRPAIRDFMQLARLSNIRLLGVSLLRSTELAGGLAPTFWSCEGLRLRALPFRLLAATPLIV
jgi:hypothetical protein